jgi:tetratricopeptide (TPR) repeat protein
LEAGELKDYPGIQAWLKDVRQATKEMDSKTPIEKWPALDVDALLAHNPNFWQAYYEIAPGDPALMILHAGLLMSAGETSRAAQILVVALQRPGIPAMFRGAMLELIGQASRAGSSSNAIVNEGIALHDKGDYAAALRKYDEAIVAWPQNSLAYYEIGYTIFVESFVAAGKKPPAAGVIVNGKQNLPAKSQEAYSKARKHDPLQYMAYQGDEKPVIDGFLVLIKLGMPVWQQLAADPEQKIDDQALQDFAKACQVAGIHELGLVARQIIVARRGRYAPADHPYLTTSLRQLAPDERTEALLKRLATGELQLRQLVAPEAEREKSIASQIMLYVPTPELPKRLGEDVEPLGDYINALDVPIRKWIAAEKPQAQGLLVAVGIKKGKKSRAWCQAVEGEIPADALQRLEQELAKVPTIELSNEPVAFALQIVFPEKQVEKFPDFPQVWIDAMKNSQEKVIVPPDGLFKIIWPD